MKIKLIQSKEGKKVKTISSRIKIGEFKEYLEPFEDCSDWLDFVFYDETRHESIIIFEKGQNQIKLICNQMTPKTFETFKKTLKGAFPQL